MPSFALGQHVRHAESKRNAFVNSQEAERMSFYFPDINKSQQRWAHTFKPASSLILDLSQAEWAPGIDQFGGRMWWTEDDGKWRSVGSRGIVELVCE